MQNNLPLPLTGTGSCKPVAGGIVPLPEIRDNHPKYVVSMDELWRDNIEGIKHISVYITGVARVLELKRNGD